MATDDTATKKIEYDREKWKIVEYEQLHRMPANYMETLYVSPN